MKSGKKQVAIRLFINSLIKIKEYINITPLKLLRTLFYKSTIYFGIKTTLLDAKKISTPYMLEKKKNNVYLFIIF